MPPSGQPANSPNGTAGYPQQLPSSLPVFWVVCLVTIVMSHYALAARLNLPYKLLTVLIVVLAPFTAGFTKLLVQRQVLWLLAFEVVLVVGCLVGYTGKPTDLLSVGSDPIVMIRVFPMMLCGYTLAQYPRQEKRWILALLLLYALLTLPDAITMGRGSLQGLKRERLMTQSYDEASAQAILSGYVNLSVVCLIVAVLANRLRDQIRGGMRWIISAAQAVVASVCVTAGFTAAALLLLFTAALLTITAPVRTLRYRLVVMTVIPIVLVVAWAVFASFAAETGGTLGQIYRRLEGLRKAVFTVQTTEDTSEATSGRVELGLMSIRSFMESPLIGKGMGKESEVLKGHISDTIGGHSYILDSLGQRGLVGTLPLLGALGSLLFTAWRCYRTAPGSWRESAMLTFMPMWIFAMVINPYFLGYLALNCIVFFSFGLIMGDSLRLKAVAARSSRPALPRGRVAPAVAHLPPL